MIMLDGPNSPEEGQQAVMILSNNDDNVVNGEQIDANHNNTTISNMKNIEETEEPSSPQQPFCRKHKQLILIAAICTLVIIIIVAVSVPLTRDTRSKSSNVRAETDYLSGSGISTAYPTTSTYPSQAPSVSQYDTVIYHVYFLCI